MLFSVSNRTPAKRALALASAISTCFIPFSLAHAQEDKSLPPVVVTASRVAQLQSEALPHTTVITAEDIRNSQAPDLPSLLRREASIQLTQNGGVGSSGGIFMRGTESRQTLVLLDGVPLTKQDASGTPSLEHIMLSQVERIEIVRGNVSAIYGSGAIGGVIQIFTKRGEGKPQASLTAEAGSRGTFRTTAEVSGMVEATRFSLSTSRYKTDGYSAINTKQKPTANPDKDSYDNVSVSGSISQEVAKGHELGLRFYSTDARFDFDSALSSDTSADVHTGKTTDQMITVFSKNRINTDWVSNLSYSDKRSRNGNTYLSGTTINRDYFTTRTDQLLWANEYSLNQNVLLTGGLEHQNQSVEVDGWGTPYDKSRDANAVYAGLQGKLGAHQFQLNARYDDVGHVGSETTGYAGYGYSVNDSLKLIASASSAFNAPPLGYLYAPFIGNPSLKPERARSMEAGAQYAVGGQLLRATLFRTRTKDQLDLDSLWVFQNIHRVRNEGLEVSYAGKVADVNLHGSLTLQDPKNEDTDERLNRRARTLFSLAATRDFGRWRVGGDVQYTGEREDGSERLGSYAVFNFNLRYQATRDVSLFGRIENVFDREYQTAYGYDMPSRGVFAGVNLKL